MPALGKGQNQRSNIMANPLKMLKLKPTGFQFIQEVSVNAPPRKVWSALLNVGKWFVFDRTGGNWPKSKFEARTGGQWIMTHKDGSTDLVATVTRVEPQKLLRLTGPIGLSHLPVCNAFIFELQPQKDGKATLLRLGQRTFGLLDTDVKTRYATVWKRLLGQIKDVAEK
jgi:uncharacterized protein YndB with AHSA1/START domain